MGSFLDTFLAEAPPFSDGGQARRVFFAVFGKHPGWDDHIEDIGIETMSLAAAKQLLYNQGIRGQLESGAWERLEPGKLVGELRHLFIWARRGQMLAGRFWPSKDGKGRALYPMGACFHVFGLGFSDAARRLLPGLESFERACRETSRTEAVRELVSRELEAARDELRAVPEGVWNAGETAAETERVLGAMGLGPNAPGLWRVVYEVENGLKDYRAGQPRKKGEALRSHQLRVPCAREWVGETANFWRRLLLERLDAGVPMLFTAPVGASWIDITVGEPTAEDFFSLRAAPQALPLASEIPYSLTPEFVEAAKAALERFIRTPTEPKPGFSDQVNRRSGLRRLFEFWSRG